ncbi:TonB-dependent receptor [Paucibacter sp. PLA-PC-4]|uniref:TonB-dependent receptor plug domain-containing protein n=1 Tax=Paucibacter sp. PLA-PC-4 TaxID=2993655 RepID=UPI00224AFE56|nr:TonB-dependent receptor [Paucibacter sp. PLA-PC-4]MCX2864056.1 TonB-dependent receptor [Paucibacter sp. PLA-PC-4]
MFKLNPISIAIAATVALHATPVLAQQGQPGSAQLERVEVTGSRISSLNAESAAPIQVLSAADIASSGAANLQELLLKSPVFGTPAISRNNSNFSTSSAGVATVDLRNLGSNRTLVLVNGRRYVSGVPGSSAVDFNTIPADFIERVEIMTGGASSTYGSDAVAGVVNVILKRNLQGMKFDAQVGQSEEGDDTKKKVSATFGMNGSDGRSNLMFNLSASQQGAVYSRDRSFAAVDQASKGAFVTGEVGDIFVIQRPFFSSFAPQGRFFYNDGTANRNFTYNAAGAEIPFSTNGPAGDGVGATGYNRSAVRTIAVPTDRLMLASKGEFGLNDAHSVYFEANYAATKTKTRLEPYPLDSTDLGGLIPAEFMVNGVKLRNPLVPNTIYNNAVDRDGDGLKDYNFTRRMSDVEVRGNKANRDTFRVVGGLKGELNKTWSYDAYAVHSFTKEGQTGTGQVNVMNFMNALSAVQDVNDINGNGSTTDAICKDAIARAQGCVPANIFGANTLSAEASKYIHAPSSLNTRLTQNLLGASVNGEPFSLPAGPVGLAFGAEYRKETSSTEFDALTQTGLNAGNALPNTKGEFDVKELFAEVRLPLLKNLPLVKSLDAAAAVRHGKYSTVGNTTSWNTGMDWALNSTFRVRANYSVSTRAPNIDELFQAPSQTFPTGLADPCEGVKSTDTSATAVACKAVPGVAANMAANGGVFTLTQPDQQGISGFDSGNPNLKAEKGKSTTFGFVITPKTIDLLRNFTFTADYYDIKIKDAINTPGRQYALDQCYGGGNTSFCQFIKRRPADIGPNSAGSIEFIDETAANTGGDRVEGVDVTASYQTRLGGGTLNSRLAYTYIMTAYNQATPQAAKDYSQGQMQNDVTNPRNRWILNLGYSMGNWGVAATTTYFGTVYLDDTFMNSNFPGWKKSDAKVKAKAYLDLQGHYRFGKAEVYLGIDNALGTKAPPIISGLPGNTTGAETNASVYDPIGRRYYIGVRYSM